MLVTDSTDGPGTGDWTPATDTQRQAVDGPIGNALTTHDDVYVVNALGVGTANPLQQFVVSNNGALGFEVAPFVGTVVLQAFDRQVGGYGRLRLDTSPSGPTMLLDQRGNVGIGTITPTTRLHVAGTVNATAFVGDGRA